MTKKKTYTYRCWKCNKTNEFGFCLDCTDTCGYCGAQKSEHIQIFEKYLCPRSFFISNNDPSLL